MIANDSRRRFLKALASGGAALGGGAISYAHWVEPRKTTVTHQTMKVRDLPDALVGFKIAQLTDLHFRPGTDDQLIQSVVKRCNAEKPDLIVLTGDYVNRDKRVLGPLMELLEPLRANQGVLGIMGNHDATHASVDLVRNAMQKAGIGFLVNQGTRLTVRDASLFVAATDSIWTGNPDLSRAMRGRKKTEPCLALIHEPDFYDTVRQDYQGVVQLSGHTHGGQCRVPILGYAPIKVTLGRRYIYGAFQHQDSGLFVSRGVGTVTLRVRFACPPEVAIIKLARR